MKKLALVDIDGVIADDRHRIGFALNRDWDNYFAPSRVFSDEAWPLGKTLLRILQEDDWIIAYLTGRRDTLREVTEEWIDKQEYPMGRLTMRREAQKMPLANFKEAYIRQICAQGSYSDVVLFDDDPEVVRHVQQEIGPDHAMLCDWHVKQKALIKSASA